VREYTRNNTREFVLKEGQPLASIREAPIELRFTEPQSLYRNRYYRTIPS
jgi:hypothetical protein